MYLYIFLILILHGKKKRSVNMNVTKKHRISRKKHSTKYV